MTDLQRQLLALVAEEMGLRITQHAHAAALRAVAKQHDAISDAAWGRLCPLAQYLAECDECRPAIDALQQLLHDQCSALGLILNVGDLPRRPRDMPY
jgi:hypothetical protein